jgi:hypothetical protein
MYKYIITVIISCMLFVLPIEPAEAQICKVLHPGANLPQVALISPNDTCFNLNNGVYKVSQAILTSSGDTWQDATPNDGIKPKITGITGAENIFYGGDGPNVTMKNLHIDNAISEDWCENTMPLCGRGISRVGSNFVGENLLLTNHNNSGIGAPGGNALIKNVTCINIGTAEFTKLDRNDNGPSDSACIKTVSSIIIIGGTATDMFWNAFWIDGGDSFVVKNTTIRRYGHVGIQYEISSGPAEISGNLIENGGIGAKVSNDNKNAAMKILDSRDANVFNNTIRQNKGLGMELVTGRRQPGSFNNRIHHNFFGADEPLVGCDRNGFHCYDNVGVKNAA